MKKILVFVAVAAMVMGGYVYKMQSFDRMPSLILENIEALANSETDYVFCIGIGSVDCPINNSKVYSYEYQYSLWH